MVRLILRIINYLGDNLAAPIKMEDTIPLAQQLHFKEFILQESTHLSVQRCMHKVNHSHIVCNRKNSESTWIAYQ